MSAEEITPPADFFISYTGVDEGWAVLIAWWLEEAGYRVILQAWDFRPGNNFVVMMNKAAQAKQTIAIISPAYLEASYTQPEWAAAFVSDPTGMGCKLIPIRIKQCKLNELWAAIVYIDFVGCDRDAARDRLLNGIKSGRAKPMDEPRFPGSE